MIDITAAAADQMREMISKTPEATIMLLGVTGGGCSGLSYVLRPSPHPVLFMGKTMWNPVLGYDSTGKSVWVFVDYNSMRYLDGMRVDFVKELIGNHFTFTNPNAGKTCGCGTSFTPK